MRGVCLSPSQLNEISVLKVLNKFASEVFSISEIGDLLWHTTGEVVAQMGFVDCVIYSIDEDEKNLRPVATGGAKHPKNQKSSEALVIPFGHGITGSVATSGKPCVVADLNQDARYITDIEPARSEICVPIIVRGIVIGVIDCKDLKANAFSAFHLETLIAIATMLGTKLAALYAEQEFREQNIALRHSEERFNLAMRGANDGLWDWDLRTDKVFFSPRWFEMLGYTACEWPNTHETFEALLHPEDRELTIGCKNDVIAAGDEALVSEFRMRHKNGGCIDILSRAFVVWDKNEAIRVVGTHVDITDRKEDARTLKRNAHRLKEALRVASVAGWEVDEDGNLLWSPEIYDLFKIDPDDFDDPAQAFRNTIHPDDLDGTIEKFNSAWLEKHRYSCVYRVALSDGSVRVIRQSGDPIIDESGTVVRVSGIVQDITEQTHLEARFQQAQKMEAIGQLTGGIAHDFNNLLAVIMGNAELLEYVDGTKSAMTSAIIRASERGAELTQRLLAFSRMQPLKPEEIDLCQLMTGMLDLMRRTLGETIQISTYAHDGLWDAHADSGQVENALLNLVINARDAMPDGGNLTIECTNVSLEGNNMAMNLDIAAGDYVVLSVTDQGDGMSEDVRKRAFEPFFTTKEAGKGSGLGLSMVFGFAQQSGGQATIYSEEGKGTTVKLYLPRATTKVDSLMLNYPDAVPWGTGETILVIEDDPEVRDLAEMMLMNLGYKVVCTEDISDARRAIHDHSKIDLILSDVVLPGGTSGSEFAEELRTSHPEMKIIFMSGYPAKAAKHNGFLDSDRVLLNKPFRIAQLAKAVKAAMD